MSTRKFPRPDFESMDPLCAPITRLTSFHYYEDAFDVALIRANSTGSDFGIRKAYDLEYCNVGESHTKIGEKIPKAHYSIKLLLSPKYRSGRELTIQVVEPTIMSTEDRAKRGYLDEEIVETSRTRVGRRVTVKGVGPDGEPVTIHKPASVQDLHIPHGTTVSRSTDL